MKNFRISILKASLIFLGVLISAAVLILLLGPVVPDDKQLSACVVNINLPIGGLSMNCDSPEFLRLATDPKFLFEPKNDRQSRPGYIAAAWLVSRPFLPLTFVADEMGLKAMRETPPRFTRPLVDYFPAYIAFVLLDIFFIWLTARLFWALFVDADNKISAVVFLLSLVFIFNGVFFYFFWSPHTQVFNIFVPIFCIWAAVRAYQGRLGSNKKIFLLSFLAGFGILAYTTFALFFPAVVLGEFFRQKKITKGLLLRWLISFSLIILPLALWYVIVILKNGVFYNCELDYYKYGIWNRASDFFGLVYQMYLGVSEAVRNILSKNLYIFLAGILSLLYLWEKDLSSRPTLIISVLVSLMFALFFSVLAFYPERMLLSVALPWLVPIVFLAEKNNNNRLIVLASAIYLFGWIVWMWLVGIGAR